MRSAFKIAIAGALILVAVGFIFGYVMYNKKDPDLSKVKPDFILSPSDLFGEFLSDEPAATEKYVGKILEIKGMVASVDTGTGSSVSIHIGTGNIMGDLIFTLSEKGTIPVIEEGDMVTLRGECSGFLMDVLLNNAVILEDGR